MRTRIPRAERWSEGREGGGAKDVPPGRVGVIEEESVLMHTSELLPKKAIVGRSFCERVWCCHVVLVCRLRLSWSPGPAGDSSAIHTIHVNSSVHADRGWDLSDHASEDPSHRIGLEPDGSGFKLVQ